MNRSRTILLVEDELIVRMAETAVLEAEGYTVVPAATGEEALAIARDEPRIELVLIDIQLGPGISGVQAAEAILACRDLPIVFLSSHTELDVVRTTEGIRSYGYITKDSGNPVLLASLRTAFRLYDEHRRNVGCDRIQDQGPSVDTIIEASPDGFWIVDPTGRITTVNDAYCAMSGYTRDELLTMKINEIDALETPEETQRKIARIMESGGTNFFETKHRRKDGSIFDVEFSVKLMNSDDGPYIFGFCRDITTRKERESVNQILADATRAAAKYRHDTVDYQEIAETARILSGAKYAVFNTYEPDEQTAITVGFAGTGNVISRATSILGFSPLGKRWNSNPAWTERLRRDKQMTFSTLAELAQGIVPEKIIGVTEKMLDLEQTAILGIFEGERLVGNFSLFFTTGKKLANRSAMELYGDLLGVVMTRIDAEKCAAALLGDKEVLLKEVQHRVKNNMNTMVSILSLQAGTATSPETRRALKEAESRFRSLQILYERLHGAASYDRLPLVDYLKNLVRDVTSLFPNSRDVSISVEATGDHSDLDLDTRRLSTIGLIVNELITNTMKYAFPHDADPARQPGPTLRICTHRSNDHEEIRVEDNGIGMNREPSEEAGSHSTEGFGLTMVHALTDQLQGTVRFEHLDTERKKGTRVTIRFPLKRE